MTLLRQQVKQEWISLLIWSAGLFLMLFYTVYLFETMGASMAGMEEMLKAMPEGLRGLYGGNVSIQTLSGYLQAYGFGYWVWIPFLIYTAIFAATIVTREVDRRTMEFLLALPLPRWQVVLTRYGGMALALFVLHLAQFLAIWMGVLSLEAEPQLDRYLVAMVNSLLLMLALGSVMLMVDMLIDDYGRAVGANLGIGLGLFIYHIATESATGTLRTVRDALPLSLYDPGPIIGAGTVPWAEMAILAALAAGALGLAILLFERKQIAV